MLIYYIILYSTLICGIFESKFNNTTVACTYFNIDIINKKNIICKKAIVILFFLQLLFLATFRNITVGNDLGNYLEYFRECLSFKNVSEVVGRFGYSSISYYLLNWIISNFTDNIQIFFFITSFIPLFLIFHFFYRESKIIWLSIFIFLSLANGYERVFGILRQIISVSIIMYSYKYIKTQNFKKYLLCLILAVSFHSTAIFCFPMYFFSYNKLNFLNCIKYISIALGIVITGNFAIKILLNFYQGGMYKDLAISGEGYMWLLCLIGILSIGLIFKNNMLLADKTNVIIYNIIILCVIAQLMTLNFSLFVRVVYFYSFFLTIFIPNIIYSIKNKHIRMLGICITIIFCSVFFIRGLNVDFSGIVPYSFFWEK